MWPSFLGRSHGKGCCHHVEHAWGQHVEGNSLHHKALGLEHWMLAKYMQAQCIGAQGGCASLDGVWDVYVHQVVTILASLIGTSSTIKP